MPDWRPEIQRRLSQAHLRPEREAEIVDELAQHLEDRYHASLAAGRSVAESEARAWRELEAHQILSREIARVEAPAAVNLTSAEASRPSGVIASLRHDVRYSVRALRARPLFTLTALLTVALSLGPAIAVSAVTDALFFRPLPDIGDQSRLLTFQFGQAARDSFSPWTVSYANVAEITTGATTVMGLTGRQSVSVAIAADGATPRLVSGESVMANYFDLLGVRLTAGRGFRTEEDSSPGGEPVVVINDALARDLFPRASPIGRIVHLNSLPFEIIGVAPATFHGTDSNSSEALWVTGMAQRRLNHFPPAGWVYPANRGPFYEFVVRLAPGASSVQASAELSARTRALADREPVANELFKTVAPRLMPGLAAPLSLNPAAIGTVRLLLAIAAVLVLLGMANVANLLIFQGLATGREIAIRKALGAGTRRIVQLRLVQSLLLSVVGASAGMGLALLLGGVLDTFSVPGVGQMHVLISWRVATVAGVLALVVGVGFGIAPALLAARASLTSALARGLRTGVPHLSLLRHGLTAVQLALSLTLLLGALLFLVTLRHLYAVDLGLDTTNVTTMRVNLRSHGYAPDRALDYHRRLIASIRDMPGFESVAVASGLPLLGATFGERVYPSGADPSQTTGIISNAVSADYFRVFRAPILYGRVFNDAEDFSTTPAGPEPVVVSESLARLVFGSTNVVGRRMTVPKDMVAPMHDLEIIGVVRETHFRGVIQPADPIVYEPVGLSPLPVTSVVLLVRSNLGHAEVARQVQTAAATIDPSIPMSPESTMDDLIDRQIGQQRLFAWVFGVLAVVAFVLAGAGLYGLVAQGVSERAREFGIRMAIGADPTRILELVLRQAAIVAVVGAVVGVAFGWMGGRAIQSQLFGVTSHDPWVYAVSAGLLAVVVLAASLGPARAATRVNPVDVLRSE